MAHRSQVCALLLLILLLEPEGMVELLAPSRVTLKEGTPEDFIFESDDKKLIDECRFTVPGFSEIKIFSEVKNEKYEFVGDGFSNGQCGLRLLSVNRSNAGKVKCSLFVSDNTKQEFEKQVTVLYPTEKVKIVSNSMDGLYEYIENDEMEFNCTAEGGFPAPTLSLYLNDINLANSSTERELNCKVPARMEYNDKRLECRVEQNHSLPWSHTLSDTRLLYIYYSPRLENGSSEVEVLGHEVNVSVKILANPPPYFYELTKNGEVQDIVSAKYGTITEYTLSFENASMSEQHDLKINWTLRVVNDHGEFNVNIKLPEHATTTTTTESTSESSSESIYSFSLKYCICYYFQIFVLSIFF